MLAPIVTKDMKLFPSKPVSTVQIKNVRSRAQSLQDFGQQNAAKQRVKVAPANQRNAQSVGNLSNLSSLSRSPPKATAMRKPLAAIAEGVELPSSSSNAAANDPSALPPKPQAARSVALDDLRIIAKKNFVDPTLTNSENVLDEDASPTSSSSGGKTSPSASKRLINKLTSVFKSGKKNSIDDDGSTSLHSQ